MKQSAVVFLCGAIAGVVGVNAWRKVRSRPTSDGWTPGAMMPGQGLGDWKIEFHVGESERSMTCETLDASGAVVVRGADAP